MADRTADPSSDASSTAILLHVSITLASHSLNTRKDSRSPPGVFWRKLCTASGRTEKPFNCATDNNSFLTIASLTGILSCSSFLRSDTSQQNYTSGSGMSTRRQQPRPRNPPVCLLGRPSVCPKVLPVPPRRSTSTEGGGGKGRENSTQARRLPGPATAGLVRGRPRGAFCPRPLAGRSPSHTLECLLPAVISVLRLTLTLTFTPAHQSPDALCVRPAAFWTSVFLFAWVGSGASPPQ